ncbi:MAG: electron transfer flavoprotein subunit beta/FixA family protein [Thermomicrobiales bacterium]
MSDVANGLRICVLVKQIPDPNGITIDPDTHRAVLSGAPVVNTFDTYAVAQALDLKERHGGEVTIVSAGPASAREVILRGLGTGADRGQHLLLDDADRRDSLALATLLADHLRGQDFDLILAGQTSEDLETAQVGPQVAELLDLPHVSLVTGVDYDGESLHVHRDSEGRKQVVSVPLPALLLVLSGRDGEQRHPTLRGMMQAKRKPLDVTTVPPFTGPPSMTWSEPEAPVRVRAATILRDIDPHDAAAQLAAWLREKRLIS